jgi:hypothetical protein
MRKALMGSCPTWHYRALLPGVAPCLEHGPNLLLVHLSAVSKGQHEQDSDVRRPDLPVEGDSAEISIDASQL